MKKQITVSGYQCDGCGKETEYAAECRSCNKSFDFDAICRWIIVLGLFFTGLGLIIADKENGFELLCASLLAWWFLID